MSNRKLRQILDRLPEHEPPEDLWTRIEAGLDTPGNGSRAIALSLLDALHTGIFAAVPFAPDFACRTPLGRMGLREFIDAARNLSRLLRSVELEGVMAGADRACLRYTLHFRDGRPGFKAVDWLTLEAGRIREVNAYFDASGLFNQMSA